MTIEATQTRPRSALRTIREALGLTQDELAQRAGLSRETVANAERGICTRKTAIVLAAVLGLGTDDGILELLQHPTERLWTLRLTLAESDHESKPRTAPRANPQGAPD